MASGIFDTHPTLTAILGHLGEMLPYCIWRFDHRVTKRPREIPARSDVHRVPAVELLRDDERQFPHADARQCAIAELGVDRVLFSVDYPFEEVVDAATWFDNAEISEADRLKIGRTNAATLFKIV